MTVLTKLTGGDISRIMRSYDLGKLLEQEVVWWALGNSIYLIRTSKGRFVLKIHERIRSRNFNYVLGVMEFARKNKVPELIKTKKGSLYLLRDKKRVTIQRFVEGEEGRTKNLKTIISAARTIGRLDKTLAKLPLEGKFTWNDNQFRCRVSRFTRLSGISLAKDGKRLLSERAGIDRSKLRRSTIHSDLGESNMLVRNNRIVAILDWDDVHEDFIAYDPAVFIAGNTVTPERVMKNKVRLFLREYQRYIRLNDEEIKALYYFVKYRYLAAAEWVVRQTKTRPESRKHDLDWAAKTVRRYKRFSRMSLKEFQELAR